MSRLLSWFTTRSGRIFTSTCVGVVGVTAFGVQVGLHGPLQGQLIKLCQVYDHGKPKPLSESVKLLTKKVLQECTLEPAKKKKIKFFNVIGHELYHSGGINSPWGALIGIPFNFDDPDNIDFSALRVEGHDSLDWVIDGMDLLESLSLSEKAKKFGLMREIHASNFWDVLDNAAISSGCFLLPAAFIKKINNQRNLLTTTKLGTRLKFYLLFYACGYIVYRCLKDPTSHITSRKSDKLAAMTSPEYIDGGIEFYEKVLEKNKALRQLLGAKGERMFNKNGDESYVLFTPKLPTRRRIELLKDLKTEALTVPA